MVARHIVDTESDGRRAIDGGDERRVKERRDLMFRLIHGRPLVVKAY